MSLDRGRRVLDVKSVGKPWRNCKPTLTMMAITVPACDHLIDGFKKHEV